MATPSSANTLQFPGLPWGLHTHWPSSCLSPALGPDCPPSFSRNGWPTWVLSTLCTFCVLPYQNANEMPLFTYQICRNQDNKTQEENQNTLIWLGEDDTGTLLVHRQIGMSFLEAMWEYLKNLQKVHSLCFSYGLNCVPQRHTSRSWAHECDLI